MRHYEGGKTSTKINKILDFVREGHSLDETINKFKTDAWNADDITKVFNDYKNGVYIYVAGTPERIERVQVANPDWFPLFNGTEEKNEEIIENYNENSSTPAVGRGYHNYSMSNNAVDAYKKGSMPLSKWNKKNIIEKIADITEKYNIPFDVSKLDKMTLKDIKDEYLKKDGYHHTSKFYNTTDFYKVDIEKILENTFSKEKYLDEVKSNLEYKKFVNKVLSGKLSKQEKSKPVILGKTPAKLIEAGLPDNDISIGYKIIEKAQNNKNTDHNLSKETISEVWNALKNPIAVIKAEQNENEKKENNRYSAILDLQDDNGKYVLVAIETDKEIRNIKINDIRSIHARKSYEPIIDKALNDKRLLKVDADKIRNLLWGSSDIISEGDQASSEKDLLKPKIQSDLISDGVASLIERIAQQKNDVKFYQSAYHGTPHRFDEFSTEHIGSGEGAQAHGWGLYFAGNKEVSESYRKTLAQSLKNAKYNGVPLSKTELTKLHSAISEKLYLKGKDEALKELELLRKQSEKNKDKEGFLGRSSRKFLEEYNGQLELLNSVDESKITGVNKGQLYEVDIPEDDVLLDEDKKFSEQSEFVQEKVKELFNNEIENGEKYLKDIIKHNYNGKGIYETIRERKAFEELGESLGGHYKNKYNDEFYKQASLLLNEYGIKGIKYDGRQDGECYVIFDDKAVKVLKTYYQEINPEQQNIFQGNRKAKEIHKVKGGYLPAEKFIELFKNADASTIVHELVHWYLDELTRVAQYNDEIAQDLEAVNIKSK